MNKIKHFLNTCIVPNIDLIYGIIDNNQQYIADND